MAQNFIDHAKEYLRDLAKELNSRVPYASILAEDANAKQYRVSASGSSTGEMSMFSSHGFVIRIWNHGFAEYSFNVIPDIPASEYAEKILSFLKPPMTMDPMPDDSPKELSASTPYKIDPEELGTKRILEKMHDIRQKACALDERILDCIASCNYQRRHTLFISRNRTLEQHTMWMCASLAVLANGKDGVKDAYKGFSNLGGAEVLDVMEAGIEPTVKMAMDLLEAEPIVPGEYDCICTPDVTGMIVHEAFGHGVEMDMFVKKRALAEEYVGKEVASPLVTMRDGAASAQEAATFFFDDEGSLAGDTVVIENGILKQGICDAVSAGRLSSKPTGNGRRESYRRKAYTRMTNTYFTAGSSTPEEMIASVKYGFLLDNPTSGMEDPKNWGIQCMVNIAREIKDGKLTGKVFSPIVLTGYVPDLLRSISMVSDKVALEGGGYCGKGYKEWVKVSDGGAYIKAKIRLG